MAELDRLSRLAIKHGTDKFGGHLYTPIYDRMFSARADEPVRLLELGVGGYKMPLTGGRSLFCWAEYFPNGHIVGIDIEKKRLALPPRVFVERGSQTDLAFLDDVWRRHGPFDIIIDDGSHIVDHVITSFKHLYPKMPDNGVYVVEDTQTAFWPRYGGNAGGRASIFTLANEISLAMHEIEVKAVNGTPEFTEFGSSTESVQVFRNMIAFYRGANTYPSNQKFDIGHPDVRAVYDALHREKTPGAFLTRMSLAKSASRPDLGAAAAEEAVAAFPQRVDIVIAALKAMDAAGRADRCLKLAENLAALVPDDPAVQAVVKSIRKKFGGMPNRRNQRAPA